MAVYKTLAGFVQFEPNEREAAGQTIRDFVIQPIGQGTEIPSVRITLWPEYAGIAVGKGDFVCAQGKFTTANVKGKTYFNLSASDLVVTTAAAKSTDEIENPVEEEDEDFDPGF